MPQIKQWRTRIYCAKGDTSKRWYVEVYVSEPKPRRMQFYQDINKTADARKRMKAARDLERALADLLERGVDISPNCNPLLGLGICGALEAKLAELRSSIRPGTHETYTSALKRFKTWLEEVDLSDIPTVNFTKAHVRQYTDWLRAKPGISNATRNAYARQIRSLFGHLVEDNPFKGCRMLKERRERNAPIQPQHMGIILEEMQRTNPCLKIFFMSMYYLGTRRSELCGLLVSDILRAEHTVRLRASITKNGLESWAIIPAVFREELYAWIEGAGENWYVFGGASGPGPGKPKPNNFTRGAIRVMARTGMNVHGYSLYSARHTSARALALSGANLLDISAHLRHSSPRVTEFYLREIGGRINKKFEETFPVLGS